MLIINQELSIFVLSQKLFDKNEGKKRKSDDFYAEVISIFCTHFNADINPIRRCN